MEAKDILSDTSVLYRCTQKYYDKNLEKANINFSQLPILILIYENEGITMNRLAESGGYDKGTITKSIQKLMQSGHVQMVSDEEDKRVKRLYTTDQTRQIIADLYLARSDWWEHLTKGLSESEVEQFARLQAKICENARLFTQVERNDLKLFGIQKLTLLDYPGKVASTVFTGGCNFRCPFCQNSDLVFLKEYTTEIGMEQVYTYLNKRVGMLDGVCVSGGEPLMHDLRPLLTKLKEMGYLVKLDTNGSYPKQLKELVLDGLVDMVAMDVKNGKKRYAETIGVDVFDLAPIEESIAFLKEGHVPYEFRTTIVKEFHSEEDIEELGRWLTGAKQVYLQQFRDGETVIQAGLHAVSEATLCQYKKILSNYVEHVEIRGIDVKGED